MKLLFARSLYVAAEMNSYIDWDEKSKRKSEGNSEGEKERFTVDADLRSFPYLYDQSNQINVRDDREVDECPCQTEKWHCTPWARAFRLSNLKALKIRVSSFWGAGQREQWIW